MEFPIVDAYLITPDDAKNGHVGICTNTTAPGQVYNEIEQSNRPTVSVLGTLIANRDGTERMILNTLIHPHIKYLVLFSEETITFSPSTNLLIALMNGLDTKNSNYILGGQAASAYYPNLSQELLDTFNEEVVVLPLFMFKNDFSKEIIDQYLDWLGDRVPKEIVDYLRTANEKKKIYYDVLNGLLALLGQNVGEPKTVVELDPKQFQHLQPPVVELEDLDEKIGVSYRASVSGGRIRLDIQIDGEGYWIEGVDEFLLEYSVMKFLGDRKADMSVKEQLYLGVELSRINVEIQDGITVDPFVKEWDGTGTTEIPLLAATDLKPDEEFYYKFALRDDQVTVSCLAFDVCEAVYELRGKSLPAIIDWLAEHNRFQDYEMDILHRMDTGSQVARAAIANSLGYSFIQDFYHLFRINTERLPFFMVDSDNFLDGHKNIIKSLYTGGITEGHADEHKGLARTGSILAIYRDAGVALGSIPQLYQQGELSIDEMREKYKEQLLRFDHDGNYSYGERTRAYFGFDQLPRAVEVLQEQPTRAYIIQRYDPSVDMGIGINPDTGKIKYTHDPCLTHDILFQSDGRLYSFHIARAHNTVNAYPENVFGLFDAYVQSTAEGLGLPVGDMMMLSSRANILMLTEEQRAKKIIAEPSKGVQEKPVDIGPVTLESKQLPDQARVAYETIALEFHADRPAHPFLDKLLNYQGTDTLERTILYFESKGPGHMNPIMTTYDPRIDDPVGDHMPFFQANVYGGKLTATCVFVNRSLDNRDVDKDLINYLSTTIANRLGVPMDQVTIFYINY